MTALINASKPIAMKKRRQVLQIAKSCLSVIMICSLLSSNAYAKSLYETFNHATYLGKEASF
jgi:hypothetical protein